MVERRRTKTDKRGGGDYQLPLAFPPDVPLSSNPSFEVPTLEARHNQAVEEAEERGAMYYRPKTRRPK